jgi:hypothetical protein
MKNLRYVLAGLLGLVAAGDLFFRVGPGRLSGYDGMSDRMFSTAVIYPVSVIAFALVFWIVYAALDPGTEH